MARQFSDADARVLRWSAAEILRWTTTPQTACPVYHIHGAQDGIILAQNCRPDVLIPDGGHVISLSHANEVNRFLQDVLDRHG